MNEEELERLSQISNAVLTPHLIDQSFWDFADQERKIRPKGNYGPKNYKACSEQLSKDMRRRSFLWAHSLSKSKGAVFSCLIDDVPIRFYRFELCRRTQLQVQRARNNYRKSCLDID